MNLATVATLGFDFDGSGATQATTAMDKVAKAARGVESSTVGAESATGRLGMAARGSAGSAGVLDVALRQQQAVMLIHKNSTGLASHELTNFGRQFADIGVQLGAGQSPFLVLLQQGPQIADIFATASARGVGFRAALMGIVGMISPVVVGLGLVGGAIALVAGGFLKGEQSATAYERAATGVGRTAGLTAQQLRDLAAAGADQGNISIASAQRQEAVYLSTGRVGKESLGTLLRIGKDYASFMNLDAAKATESLARAMEDPAKAGREMTRTFGLLTQEQLRQMDAAQRAGDQAKSQGILLRALDEAVADHAQNIGQITSAWDAVGRSISNAITRFGEWLYVTKEERLAKIQTQIQSSEDRNDVFRARGGVAPVSNDRLRVLAAQAGMLQIEIENDRARAAGAAARGSTNQNAQIAYDNRDRSHHGPSAAERRAETLAREMEALKATTAANYELARAYGVSDAAALQAAAAAEATGKAIRSQGDVAAFVAAQLEVNASKAAVGAAQQIADMNATSAQRERLNALVAAGVVTADQANQQLGLEATLRPLVAYAAIAEGQSKTELLSIIDKLTAATNRANDASLQTRMIQGAQRDRERLTILREEIALVGASVEKRTVALALAVREQELHGMGATPGTAGYQEALDYAGQIAAAEVEKQQATAAYNLELTYGLDLARQIDAQMRSAGQGMAEAFGAQGKALGDLLSLMAGYSTRMHEIADAERRYRESVGGKHIEAKQLALFERQRAEAQVENYGNMLTAAQGFFKQGSAGWRVMETAEQGYRAIQLAMAIRAMLTDTAETGTKVVNSGVRIGADSTETAIKTANTLARMGLDTAETGVSSTNSAIRLTLQIKETFGVVAHTAIRAAAYAAEAVARVFATIPFPFNIAAAATLVAVMAAYGLKGGKGGGGGGGSSAGASDPSSPTSARPPSQPAPLRSPSGAAGAGKGTMIFDMRGAVMTEDLMRQIENAAAGSTDVAVQKSRKAVPADQARADRFALAGK